MNRPSRRLADTVLTRRICGTEVGAVRSAVAAGVAAITREGMLIAEVVIPFAHPALVKALTS